MPGEFAGSGGGFTPIDFRRAEETAEERLGDIVEKLDEIVVGSAVVADPDLPSGRRLADARKLQLSFGGGLGKVGAGTLAPGSLMVTGVVPGDPGGAGAGSASSSELVTSSSLSSSGLSSGNPPQTASYPNGNRPTGTLEEKAAAINALPVQTGAVFSPIVRIDLADGSDDGSLIIQPNMFKWRAESSIDLGGGVQASQISPNPVVKLADEPAWTLDGVDAKPGDLVQSPVVMTAAVVFNTLDVRWSMNPRNRLATEEALRGVLELSTLLQEELLISRITPTIPTISGELPTVGQILPPNYFARERERARVREEEAMGDTDEEDTTELQGAELSKRRRLERERSRILKAMSTPAAELSKTRAENGNSGVPRMEELVAAGAEEREDKATSSILSGRPGAEGFRETSPRRSPSRALQKKGASLGGGLLLGGSVGASPSSSGGLISSPATLGSAPATLGSAPATLGTAENNLSPTSSQTDTPTSLSAVGAKGGPKPKATIGDLSTTTSSTTSTKTTSTTLPSYGLNAGSHLEYVLGFQTPERGFQTQAKVQMLVEGADFLSKKFLSLLDERLVANGQPPVRLKKSDLHFEPPKMVQFPMDIFEQRAEAGKLGLTPSPPADERSRIVSKISVVDGVMVSLSTAFGVVLGLMLVGFWHFWRRLNDLDGQEENLLDELAMVKMKQQEEGEAGGSPTVGADAPNNAEEQTDPAEAKQLETVAVVSENQQPASSSSTTPPVVPVPAGLSIPLSAIAESQATSRTDRSVKTGTTDNSSSSSEDEESEARSAAKTVKSFLKEESEKTGSEKPTEAADPPPKPAQPHRPSFTKSSKGKGKKKGLVSQTSQGSDLGKGAGGPQPLSPVASEQPSPIPSPRAADVPTGKGAALQRTASTASMEGAVKGSKSKGKGKGKGPEKEGGGVERQLSSGRVEGGGTEESSKGGAKGKGKPFVKGKEGTKGKGKKGLKSGASTENLQG